VKTQLIHLLVKVVLTGTIHYNSHITTLRVTDSQIIDKSKQNHRCSHSQYLQTQTWKHRYATSRHWMEEIRTKPSYWLTLHYRRLWGLKLLMLMWIDDITDATECSLEQHHISQRHGFANHKFTFYKHKVPNNKCLNHKTRCSNIIWYIC